MDLAVGLVMCNICGPCSRFGDVQNMCFFNLRFMGLKLIIEDCKTRDVCLMNGEETCKTV